MDRNDLIILLMMSTSGLFVTSAVFLTAWLRARERAIRAELGAPRQPRIPAEREDSRLNQAVEAMAMELERVGEGQRFLTRLLADRVAAEANRDARRSPDPTGPGGGRIITPH